MNKPIPMLRFHNYIFIEKVTNWIIKQFFYLNLQKLKKNISRN